MVYLVTAPVQGTQGRSKVEAIAIGTGAGSILSIFLTITVFWLWRRKHNQQVFFDMGKGNNLRILL